MTRNKPKNTLPYREPELPARTEEAAEVAEDERSQGRQRNPHHFDKTQTSLLGALQSDDETTRSEALTQLYTKYRAPLMSFLRCWFVWKFHLDEDWVENCLHQFSAEKLVHREFIRTYDRGRARFRNYLMSCLFNFALTKLRGVLRDREKLQSLDALEEAAGTAVAIGRNEQGEPSGMADSDVLWALAVLEDGLRRLRAECLAKKQQFIWAVFERRGLVPLAERESAETLDETARVVGAKVSARLSRDEISAAMTTANRKLLRHFRDVLSEYSRNAEEIEVELRDLLQALLRGYKLGLRPRVE